MDAVRPDISGPTHMCPPGKMPLGQVVNGIALHCTVGLSGCEGLHYLSFSHYQRENVSEHCRGHF